jgi:hypothetical protein
MRNWLQLFESIDDGSTDKLWWKGGPWSARSPMQLRGYAETEGMARSGKIDASELTWTFEASFPLSQLMALKGSVEAWAAWREGEDLDGYDSDMGSVGRDDPIVVALAPDLDLWDGWHRVSGAIISGETTIAAVVGR